MSTVRRLSSLVNVKPERISRSIFAVADVEYSAEGQYSFLAKPRRSASEPLSTILQRRRATTSARIEQQAQRLLASA